MNLLVEARSFLEAAGYRTSGADTSTVTCYFEDDSVMGLVTVHASVESLLLEWEHLQDSFLEEYAGRLRTHPAKAWNIYTIHLTNSPSPPHLVSSLFNVEEDFRGTRKIARAGIRTKEELRQALLSLLPIQNRITLSREDLVDRIRERVVTHHPSLAQLFENTPEQAIANALLEEQQ